MKSNLPTQINHYTSGIYPKHWHPEIELFFVLDGTAEIYIEDDSFLVQAEDVFLINANDMHQIVGNSFDMLSIEFHFSELPFTGSADTPRFQLNSAGQTNSAQYDAIRYLIAQFVKSDLSGIHFYKKLSMTYNLLNYLIENFQTAPLNGITNSRKNRERILSIMSYMKEHYTECLTLSDVAKSQNLSAPYLSSFFEKNTGKTFLTFYNEIRLSHAIDALLSSDESIESIATSNGFSDPRSFVSLFKKKYNMLPSAFRKEHSYTAFTNTENTATVADHNNAHLLSFPTLTKHLSDVSNKNATSSSENTITRVMDAGTINLKSETIPLTHNFHNVISVGSAKQLLYQEVQEMLRNVQKNIRYNYVKFDGILSAEMMAYTIQPDGSMHYTFTLVDKIIDFMLSVGLRPLCQFSVSATHTMEQWENLINSFVRHFVSRYGLEEVRKWLFCIWNDPVAQSNNTLFFEMYRLTYQTIKSIDNGFFLGTPSLNISITEESGWASDFFLFCKNNKCPADFLNIQFHNVGLHLSPDTKTESASLLEDPYGFTKFINKIKFLLKKYNMQTMPIYLTEWDLTISHRAPINDTCFKACYLVKNLLENYDRLDSYSYGYLTDFIEFLPIPNELYHGGPGMFTYNGIPKAHYNAFRFLNRLGDKLIGKGDGYFITKKESRIIILAYNYEHYSNSFTSISPSGDSNENRYTPFTEMRNVEFRVEFSNLSNDKCLVRERFINQSYGSSYDTWVQMGNQPLYHEEDLDLLRQQSQPGAFFHTEITKDHLLSLQIQMAPLEVRLIEIDFID